MIELNNERMEQILHDETAKTEDLTTILRGIYTRYMILYERYFAGFDALNDDKIAEFPERHRHKVGADLFGLSVHPIAFLLIFAMKNPSHPSRCGRKTRLSSASNTG